jgi:branched-chain amino acid aminotransferase
MNHPRQNAHPRQNERVAYHNGRILPESEVLISFRDRGFLFGDAVFDTARTFAHKPFRLKEHVDRLFHSLDYLRIDPGLTPAETVAISEEVLARNLHLIDKEDDYWLTQRISRGPLSLDRDTSAVGKPTVIVECQPLPLKARAKNFRDGIEVVVPPTRRTPPDSFSPRAKSHNYLNMIIGDHEARSLNPNSWAVLLDHSGNLAEGMGSNIFLVREGKLLTPRERFVLPGISRATVMELAKKLGIPIAEQDIDLYDAYTAQEAFLTSTSLCLCPVRSINGALIGEGKVPGPVTRRLSDAYVELAGCDFVVQYLRHLS